MPIAPENRWSNPIDWRELSRLIRFGRAKGRCERCGRPRGRDVVQLNDGTWWDEERGRWRDGRGRRVWGLPHPDLIEARQPALEGFGPVAILPVTFVVLASCDLGRDLGRDGPRDFAALCQRCHMLHDAPEHRRTRWRKEFRRRASANLFLASRQARPPRCADAKAAGGGLEPGRVGAAQPRPAIRAGLDRGVSLRCAPTGATR